jgi:hypothetical protein
METATNHQNAKCFMPKGALAGVIATLTMHCLSAMLHRLGLTAPLAPNVIGRWSASILLIQPFHSEIGQSPAFKNEMAIGVAGHYAIGVMLACLYIWVTIRLRWRPRHFRYALGYSACMNALPWLIMFPAIGYGFFGTHGPSGTRLFLSSVCSHVSYGVGLWMAMHVVAAKAFDGYTQPDFKGEAAR